MKTKSGQSGFTLVETLVSVVVFGIFALLISNIFISILGNSARQQIITELKHQGDYALTVMEQEIRSAKQVFPCSTGMDNIILEKSDGSSTQFYTGTNNAVEAVAMEENMPGGTIKFLTGQSVKVSSLSGAGLTFDCDGSTLPQSVVVSFTLEHALFTGTPIPGKMEEAASLPFTTTVVLRE